MTPKLTLLEDVFKSPKRHLKHHLAADVNGKPCYPESPNATCWCLQGGGMKVGLSDEDWEALKAAVKHRCGLPIAIFNDLQGTSVEAILDVINDAKILRAGGTLPKRDTPWQIILISIAILGMAAALVWMFT